MSEEKKEQKSVKEITQNTIEKGGVLAYLYFDVLTDDKEKAEGMLIDLSNRMMNEEGVVYVVSNIERAIETEDKKYSAAAQVKVLTISFRSLIRLCMLYGPMAIEILEPNEIKLSLPDAQQILFDTAQMSHEFTITMLYKILTPAERIDLEKKLKKRAELGKELLKKEGIKEKGSEK